MCLVCLPIVYASVLGLVMGLRIVPRLRPCDRRTFAPHLKDITSDPTPHGVRALNLVYFGFTKSRDRSSRSHLVEHRAVPYIG